MHKNVILCDRCGSEIQTREVASTIIVKTHKEFYFGNKKNDGSQGDLCGGCTNTLTKWLGKDNTVSAGYPPVGYRESCPHHVPCAGPCPDAHLSRI